MPQKFEILSEEIIYQDKYRTFKKLAIARDGVPGVYTYSSGKKVVAILPVSETGRIPIIRQYRFPLRRDKWEICVGTLDPGETFEEAAKRELREEMGLDTDKFIKLGQGYPSSGDTDTFAEFFLVHLTDEELNQLKTPDQMDEILELKIVTLSELDDMTERGELECGYVFTALYHLNRYLRKRARHE